LQLGNGPKRFFEMRYSDYTTGDIEWKDEGSGNVDGSVEEGEEEENIYEVTSPNAPNSKWNHDEDCLFDGEAVRTYELAEAAGRKVETPDGDGGFNNVYYNRGLIFDIEKSNLKHLPYEEVDSGFMFNTVPEPNIYLGKADYCWFNTSPHITIDLSTEDLGTCVSEVVIKGFWGLYMVQTQFSAKQHNVCIPGVIISETFGDEESRTVASRAEIKFDEDVYGSIGIAPYTLTFKLQPTVDRMINKQATLLDIYLDCVTAQYIYLQSVEFKSASYVDSVEVIQVYERKYITSTADSLGDHNINGPKVGSNFVLQYELDMDNSGTYYAISPELNYVPEGEIEAKDKMRAVYASQQYREDVPLEIDISNILTIEQEEQKNLYGDAFNRDVDGDVMTYLSDVDGDVMTYLSVMPPAFSSFFSDHNIDINFFEQLTFTVIKPEWEDYYLQSLYTPGELWYPQGHKYQWSDEMRRMRCYEYVYGSTAFVLQQFNIMAVVFLHMDTFAGESPYDPLTALYANRMYYQLEVAQKLFGTEAGFSEAGRIMGTASSFIDNSNVGDPGAISY